MADERDKKPWQFSLKRAMGAMALICVTLAVSGFLFREVIFLGIAAVLVGIGSTVGAIVGGVNGAAVGAVLGLICFVVLGFLWITILRGDIPV